MIFSKFQKIANFQETSDKKFKNLEKRRREISEKQ
jgi:hypothetical protein